MKHIEMHCHSILSDGRNTPLEVLQEAQRKNLDFLALTDHDAIAPQEFQSQLAAVGIESCDSVEISARDYDLGKSLHLVSYAKIFHDSLHEVLDKTRNGKVAMYEGQIEKLQGLGFAGTIEGFEQYMQRKHGRGLRSANKWFLSHFLYKLPGNKEKMRAALGGEEMKNSDIVQEFYSECMKREGFLFEKYGYEVDEYEPSIEKAVEEVSRKAGGLVSMAHPNVTFGGNKGGIPEFRRTLPHYVEKGVGAIEINTQASTEWVEAIREMQQKFGLILTFGSDCHQIGYDGRDGKHASIGEINPHIAAEELERNFARFQNIIA